MKKGEMKGEGKVGSEDEREKMKGGEERGIRMKEKDKKTLVCLSLINFLSLSLSLSLSIYLSVCALDLLLRRENSQNIPQEGCTRTHLQCVYLKKNSNVSQWELSICKFMCLICIVIVSVNGYIEIKQNILKFFSEKCYVLSNISLHICN